MEGMLSRRPTHRSATAVVALLPTIEFMWVANSNSPANTISKFAVTSRRHRGLIQPTTVQLPAIHTQMRAGAARVRARFGRASIQPSYRYRHLGISCASSRHSWA